MNLDFFCFIEFLETFILTFLLALFIFWLAKLLFFKKHQYRNILMFGFAIVISFSYSFYKGWRCQTPPDSRYEFVFEKYTKVSFPKSGKIFEKHRLSGSNDAVETAIIEMSDSLEFHRLKKKIMSKRFLITKKRKRRVMYFYSDLSFNMSKVDSIISYAKKDFRLAFDNDTYQILFEKRW